MSNDELLSLYRRLDGARAAIKGLQRDLLREKRATEAALAKEPMLTDHQKEWTPIAVAGLHQDIERLTVDNARLRQALFARGVTLECNTCKKPFHFPGIDVEEDKCCKCQGG